MLWIPGTSPSRTELTDSSSAAKGESMADTARVISCYADIIAMRTPQEGAALVAACIIFVAWTLEQSCRKSAEAEAQRRDFTNAMAHEMKTPLGVIRGFAENLLENPESGKREYYLDQIIGQTEEMDGTVKEMIQVSKLDSADLVISSERIMPKI